MAINLISLKPQYFNNFFNAISLYKIKCSLQKVNSLNSLILNFNKISSTDGTSIMIEPFTFNIFLIFF